MVEVTRVERICPDAGMARVADVEPHSPSAREVGLLGNNEHEIALRGIAPQQEVLAFLEVHTCLEEHPCVGVQRLAVHGCSSARYHGCRHLPATLRAILEYSDLGSSPTTRYPTLFQKPGMHSTRPRARSRIDLSTTLAGPIHGIRPLPG